MNLNLSVLTGNWRHRLRWLCLLSGLVTGGYFAMLAIAESSTPFASYQESTLTPAVHVALMPEKPRTKPIEEVRVGDRVLGENPDRHEVEENIEEPNPKNWRHLKLRMEKIGGGTLDIELIRPQEWLEQQEAKLGSTVWLDLAEMDAVGSAELIDIQPCPTIQSGVGQVVTGTFAHPVSNNVLHVYVAGHPKPIGVTNQHLFWSESRQQFIPAGEILIGEDVLTFSGEALSVTNVVPRAEPTRVYNLEVQSEHVYHVSSLGILVHNCSWSAQKAKYMAEGDKLNISKNHIFFGERKVNPSTATGYSGDLKGFHHMGTNPRGHTIVPGSVVGPNAQGVYTAKWLGYGKTGGGKTSTFFPDSWTRVEVEAAIRQAAGSAIVRNTLVKTGPNRWKFSARVRGITIEGYLSGSKKTVMSAWPVYKP